MSDPLISSFVRRRNGPAFVLHPAAFFQRLVDDVEQLSVHAAKLVGGPLLDRFHPPGIDPQYERFLFYLFSHPPCLSSLLVQRSGIHDRLRLFVGTEHHQQITYHRRFLIFVEIDHLFAASLSSAICTIVTAPSTIFSRAEMIAAACCRRSITAAISGA